MGGAPEIESKLAAVLAADVAGYSRLMQDDAHATVTSLDACRAVFRSQIEVAGGRVVDMAGDSVLAVFTLATRAVSAAVAIQEDLAAHNASLDEGRQMRFRIGIHLGEVLHKTDGTVYGDGVNIAARLESLADPGGVCVSSVVHAVAEGKLDAGFAFAGEHEVKNISRPVGAWRVGEAEDGTQTTALNGEEASETEQQSIAVLPFDNMSGDPEQAYFSDGITEDLITDLSKVPGLFVTARNSSFVYKGKAHDLKSVARDLGVRYVLEGSVRKAGKRVRITTQLIDGKTGGHIWAERYDRELEDIFAVQDEVTATIVGQLSVHLSGPKDDVARRQKMDLVTWDLYLRAREATYHNFTRETNDWAIELLQKVVERDPTVASAHAFLGFALAMKHVNDWGEPNMEAASAAVDRAISLDPNEPHAYFGQAMVFGYSGRSDEAYEAALRAIALDPNQAKAHAVVGSASLALGNAAEAIEHFDTAMRLDPYYPHTWLHLSAMCHYMLGDYERCRALLEQRLAIHRGSDLTPFLLAATLGRLGEHEAARQYWRQAFEANPDFSPARYRERSLHKDKRHVDDITDGLRLAGIDPDVRPQ